MKEESRVNWSNAALKKEQPKRSCVRFGVTKSGAGLLRPSVDVKNKKTVFKVDKLVLNDKTQKGEGRFT